MTNKKSWVEIFIVMFISIAVLFFAAVVEYVLPVFVPAYAYLSFAISYLTLLFFLLSGNRLRAKFAVQSVFIIGLILFYSLSWTSRKLFLRDLYSIKPGMSVQRVESVMRKYNNFSQPNTKISSSGELLLINPSVAAYKHADMNDGEYNADIGVIKFENNKVVSIKFSPD